MHIYICPQRTVRVCKEREEEENMGNLSMQRVYIWIEKSNENECNVVKCKEECIATNS